MISNKRICELINQAALVDGATYIAANDGIYADFNGCRIDSDSIRHFVDLVVAEDLNQFNLEQGAQIQKLIILLETNQKAYLTELEALRDKASWAEKWRGIAVARDGDGRTVQTVQDEAIAKERKACAHLAAHFTGSYEAGQEGKAISEAILARGADERTAAEAELDALRAEIIELKSKACTSVFLIERHVPYESGEVYDAFRTKVEADTALADIVSDECRDSEHYSIAEYPLDPVDDGADGGAS